MKRKLNTFKSFCRNCEHAEVQHDDGLYGLKHFPALCFEVSDSYGKECKCLEYIPSDNLEYLEWLYEEKQNAI